MKVEDVFSMIKEQELPIESIEKMFLDHCEGQSIPDNYMIVCGELPNEISEQHELCAKMLISEGKRAAFLIRDSSIIAVLGYREEMDE